MTRKKYVFKGDDEMKFTATANKTQIIEIIISNDETILMVEESDD